MKTPNSTTQEPHLHATPNVQRRLAQGSTFALAILCIASILLAGFASSVRAQTSQPFLTSVSVDWTDVQRISRTTPTLQVVVNPPLRRGEKIHDGAFAALRALNADYVRYVPWLPYPRLAVAELEPPRSGKTSWDFSVIDPMTIDFFNATQGHPIILNFSTIPQWMFQTDKPVTYPADPYQVYWHYTQGTRLRDPSLKELADYYARLVSWYTNGGFTDETGIRHDSGYHFFIPYWEIFNEIEFEHQTSAAQYTRRYDAVASAIHAVSPRTQFVGLALADPRGHLPYFEYFLNPKNHAPGIPVDLISYHFYATPTPTETPDQWQTTFFNQANDFLAGVRKIEAIRLRLSPSTKTTLDELGVILPKDNNLDPDNRIPPIYWNAAASLYAYLYVELAKLGIDIVGESQLVGYPTQYPSVSMIDWKTAKPNARFWVLKLLKDNFAPGDQMISTTWTSRDPQNPDLEIQAWKSPTGRKLLLINKRNAPVTALLPNEATNGRIDEVNLSTAENPPASGTLTESKITLAPFEVAVVHLCNSD